MVSSERIRLDNREEGRMASLEIKSVKSPEETKPFADTESCQAPHLLYCLSGRMKVVMGDGSEGEIGPGDVASIGPDHEAWVVGDEPCVAVDFGGYAQYAKP